MATRKPRMDEINYFNGVCTPYDGGQQKVDYTGTPGLSAAFVTEVIVIYATSNCWVRIGTAPTAAVNDGNSFYFPTGFMRSIRVNIGEKLSVIQDSAGGSIHIQGGK